MTTTRKTIHNAQVIHGADFWELISQRHETVFMDAMHGNCREINETAELITCQLGINPEKAITNLYFVIALLYFQISCDDSQKAYAETLAEGLQHFCKMKMER